MCNKVIQLISLFFVLFIVALFGGCGDDDASTNPDNPGNPSTVTDIDGNVYQTVTIGSQTWMAENLKVTHYRNGDAIPNVVDSVVWNSLTTGAYCNYNNDLDFVTTYGRLYNWYAVGDTRGIAPTGWHIPTEAEWDVLIEFLGGFEVAGGKMKEAGTTHWISPNNGATNESGFTALPGGARHLEYPWPPYAPAPFQDLGESSIFWTATETVEGYAICSGQMRYDVATCGSSEYHRVRGFSIRCVKD